MTGRLRLGKMSTDIRNGSPATTRSNQGGRRTLGKKSIAIRATATRLARATATTRTMIVSGRRMAKTIGFMVSIPSDSERCRLAPSALLDELVEELVTRVEQSMIAQQDHAHRAQGRAGGDEEHDH